MYCNWLQCVTPHIIGSQEAVNKTFVIWTYEHANLFVRILAGKLFKGMLHTQSKWNKQAFFLEINVVKLIN